MNNDIKVPATHSEQQRMATLLHTPELLKEMLPLLEKSNWELDGNQWIWQKLQDHYAVHKSIPSINILCSYVENKGNPESDKVVLAAAGMLLNEYEKQTPEDRAFYATTIREGAINTRTKYAILDGAKTKDWDSIVKAITDANRQLRPMPAPINLQTLKAKPSSDKANLLNDWALERQQIIAVVAPTGIGKSVMTMQLATHFACGKETIGFRPNGVLRQLVIQNEDSDNDIAMMRDGAMQDMTDEESKLVYENLFFVRLRGTAGKSFISALDTYCDKYHPDIVFVNPLLKYYGGDPINSKEVNDFLNDLEPILEKHNCGLIFIHHTIKQNKQSKLNEVDPSYAGFGSAAWSNAVRETISIRRAKTDDTYKLLTGKRSSKWGWTEKFIQRNHIPTLPIWKEVDDQYVKGLDAMEKSSEAAKENRAIIIKHLPLSPEGITIDTLISSTGLGNSTVRKYVRELVAENTAGVLSGDANNTAKKYYRVASLPA
jgi:hypothetical protein